MDRQRIGTLVAATSLVLVLGIIYVIGGVHSDYEIDKADVSGQAVEPATPTRPFSNDETPVVLTPSDTDTPLPAWTITPLPEAEGSFYGMSDTQIAESIRAATEDEYAIYSENPVLVVAFADLEPSDGGGSLPSPERIAWGDSPDLAILLSGTFVHGSGANITSTHLIATVDRTMGRYSVLWFEDLHSALEVMPRP